MFDTVIISADWEQAAVLRAMAVATGQLQILRETVGAPTPYELVRLLNALSPHVVLVDLGLGNPGLECVASIFERAPETTIVGFRATPDRAALARKVGVHAIIPSPGGVEELQAAIYEGLHVRDGGIEKSLYSFLPSKAGSGASTVVLHTAAALARFHEQRVLVIDADLRSGILATMLNVEPVGSIQTILRSSGELGQLQWGQCVVKAFGVDFLLSSRSLDSALPEWQNYYQLINFARQHYDTILVDLPELVNAATVEIVRRSAMVFPVCTPEILSLRLTQHRCAELERWSIPEDRIGVLLNRWHRNDPAPVEIARIIGRAVQKAFPNDYAAVSAAVSAGTHVSFDTKVGKAYAEFAGSLVQQPAAARQPGLPGRLLSMFGMARS